LKTSRATPSAVCRTPRSKWRLRVNNQRLKPLTGFHDEQDGIL
jgi:hypothetical protein